MASLAGSNQREHRKTTDMNEAAQPSPTMVRPAMRSAWRRWHRRSRSNPAWLAMESAATVRRAPKRSNHMPTGTCTANSAKKKALPAQPGLRAEVEVTHEFGRDHAVRHAIELAEAGNGDQQGEEGQSRRHGAACCSRTAAGISFVVDRRLQSRRLTERRRRAGETFLLQVAGHSQIEGLSTAGSLLRGPGRDDGVLSAGSHR